ncbi:phasin family protein [Ruegeria lacuscaerulensis]|uniref:phasin family protein n=1 Tax=Ruegeria lacuscaerulensis TaxID=55218 RepID=UPI00147FD095|nr:phasin family protein [Ruegeria lacuscaerulensis]
MEKTLNFTAILNEVMGALALKAAVFEDPFKTSALLNEGLSRIALNAAEKSTEISNLWTKDTIAKLMEASKAQESPADYANAAANYVSGTFEVATEQMFAFAEIAKKTQMDTFELLMTAGNDIAIETTAVNKAANKVTATAEKVSAA